MVYEIIIDFATVCKKNTSLCIFVANDISPKELLKFQSQSDLCETN